MGYSGGDTDGRQEQLHKKIGDTLPSNLKHPPKLHSNYHSQTVGLVERFNQMPKSMQKSKLRKFIDKVGSECCNVIPHVQFSYREIHQEATMLRNQPRVALDKLKQDLEHDK